MLKNNKTNKKELEKFALKYAEEFDTTKDRVLNLIDKMVYWYEFRYPDRNITKIFGGEDPYYGDLDDIIFYNNLYFKETLNNNSKPEIKWEDFYNFDIFYNLLSEEDQMLISKPRYNYTMFGIGTYIHLTPDGVINSKDIKRLQSYHKEIKDEDIKDYHISELVLLYKKRGIKFSGSVYTTINEYNRRKNMLEQLFNFVAFKIIDQGNKNKGYRRAFLFCKEFNLNMQLLIDKGVIDTDDLNLFKQISEYCHDMEDLVTDHIMKKYLKLMNI